ncbi:MFS transporter [Chromatiaceae bacterium AAb-1]|nr:MFS transporter [Chromatiaceae bacterium AAb-1]
MLGWAGILAIVLVALNLRPVMAVVSPLLAQIQADIYLTDTMAGLLTTLPILAMGVFALLGAYIQRFIAENHGILAGTLIIALACFCRYWFDSGTALIVSAAVAGIGIALVQVLIPAFIKAYAPVQAGTLMGFYTTAIMTGAAISAAIAAPLAGVIGWQSLFIAIGIPALIAVVLWRRCTVKLPAIQKKAAVPLPVNSARAWLLMFFFGIGTGAFTLVLAWFSPYFMQLGLTATQSGLLLSGVTLCEVTAGLVISSLIHWFPDRRGVLLFILLLLLAGLIMMIVSPLQLMLAIAVCVGIGIGALFPLTLIIAMDHAHNPDEAGALLGFVQGGGYILASITPFVAGVIREQVTDLTLAWQIMIVGVVAMMLLTLRLKPGSKL